MSALTLDLFAGAVDDVERTQYQVLAGLQKVRNAFSNNRIYPHLAHLINLYRSLETVLEQSEQFRTPWTGRMKGIDLENQTVQYEWPDLDRDQIASVEALIQWALPKIQEAIEEGKAIYEFVEDNLEVETVGIVPSYVQEGYLMVPNREQSKLHVLRYTLSIYREDDERYRTLKTVLCKTLPQQGADRSPSTIKMELIEERRDLPNPATYFFQTDLAFPFEETLLPIVKRRFLRQLASETGTA